VAVAGLVDVEDRLNGSVEALHVKGEIYRPFGLAQRGRGLPAFAARGRSSVMVGPPRPRATSPQLLFLWAPLNFPDVGLHLLRYRREMGQECPGGLLDTPAPS